MKYDTKMGHISSEDEPGFYLTDRQMVAQVIALNVDFDLNLIKKKAESIGLRFLYSESLPVEGNKGIATAFYFEETQKFKGWENQENMDFLKP